MSDIQLHFDHECGLAEARRRVMHELDQAASSFGLSLDWKGNHCQVSGPARGMLEVGESEVQIELSLGFAAKMFKGQIKQQLEEKLERVLNV